MDNIEQIQQLLTQKADLQAQINLNNFDGSVEIKTIAEEHYIYLRKRVASKKQSTYVGKYSEELYALAVQQAQLLRKQKKQLRQLAKQLAELGYVESELSPRVRLNIDFARANVKNLIYDQAVLEGVATTFPQTETILNNGEIYGVKASDVQKILNLKHAWEFIVDPDVVASPADYHLLSHIAKMVNEGFFTYGGTIRSVPVAIGGSSYVPPLPLEQDVKSSIEAIMNSQQATINQAIELALYCMKTQIFLDGNKRAAIIFANHYLIKKGMGLLVVPENLVNEFKKLLVNYYEGKDIEIIKSFMREQCWRKF